MNNFKPGGQRNRKEFLGGRPKSDADYGNKKRFDSKPRFESHGRRDEGRGGSYNDRGPKEVQLFSATCTTCGKSCEVPFRPDGTKPVLCRDCFAAKNASPMAGGREHNDRFESRSNDRAPQAPRVSSAPTAPSAEIIALTKQVSSLQSKVDEILSLLQSQNAAPVVKEAPVVVKEVVAAKKVAAPKKAVAKKAVAKAVAKKVVKKVTAPKKVAPKKK